MHLRYDDDFVEAAVFLCASSRRPGAPALQIRRFHAEREKCYTVADPDERNAAFFRLHLDWFREWGLENRLASVIASFPLLERSLQALGFRKARTTSEEGAELYVNANAERHGIVALRAERFEHEDGLLRFLNHELMHVSDMVDPSFGYSRELGQFGQTPSQQRLVQERYRLLWDVTIDGRLSRTGRATVASLEQRRNEFDRAYSFLNAAKRLAVFESLWNGKSPRHQELLDLASDPRELNGSHAPVPGAPCPLCGFATFDWARGEALKANTVAAVQKDFPAWTFDQGACHRCVETYEASSGLELPATICL